ncbi:putative exported protein, partial [Candidatus Burkholderia humilis]
MIQSHPFALIKQPLLCVALTLCASLAQAQAVYPMPEAAVQAFTDATSTNDEAALSKVLGKDHARYVPTS